MGVEDFTILFDNPYRSYVAGQTVTGRIAVTCNSEEKCSNLLVTFTGQASVRWTESVGSGGQQVSYNVSDVERYVQQEMNVLSNAGQTGMIPIGYFEYPFGFVIPSNAPSTFVGEHGSIDYKIEALMKRPWKLDKSVREFVTVNGIVDMNKHEMAAVSGEVSKHKTIGCLCCARGTVGFAMRVSKSGYVPGEYISVDAEMRNDSSRNVTALRVDLIQVVTYFARGKSKTCRSSVTYAKLSGTCAFQADAIRERVLQVPPVPATVKESCRIINVCYELQATVCIQGPSFNLKGSIPLIIGSIPFTRDFRQRRESTAFTSNDGQRFTPLAPRLQLDEYPDLPTPEYATATIKPINQSSVIPELRVGSGRIAPAENATDKFAGVFTPRYITWASIFQG